MLQTSTSQSIYQICETPFVFGLITLYEVQSPKINVIRSWNKYSLLEYSGNGLDLYRDSADLQSYQFAILHNRHHISRLLTKESK